MVGGSRRFAWLLLVVATAGLLAACGGDDDTEAGAGDAETTTSEEETTTSAEDTTTSAAGADGAAGTVEITAVDIDFPDEDQQATAPAGEVEFVYTNEGQIEHTLTIEGREEDLFLEVSSQGDTDSGTIELEPGEYAYYCDVSGHREAGMEGTLTVEEG